MFFLLFSNRNWRNAVDDQNKTKAQLIIELEEIRQRVSELEASEHRYRLIAQRAEDT